MTDLRQMAEEKWLSPAEAGRILGVSAARIRQFIDQGRLVAERTVLGRLVDPVSVEKMRTERANPG